MATSRGSGHLYEHVAFDKRVDSSDGQKLYGINELG